MISASSLTLLGHTFLQTKDSAYSWVIEKLDEMEAQGLATAVVAVEILWWLQIALSN